MKPAMDSENYFTAYSRSRNGWCVYKREGLAKARHIAGPYATQSEADAWMAAPKVTKLKKRG